MDRGSDREVGDSSERVCRLCRAGRKRGGGESFVGNSASSSFGADGGWAPRGVAG